MDFYDAYKYTEAVLTPPLVAAVLMVTAALAPTLAMTMAHRLRLSTLGTGIAVFGFGLALAVGLIQKATRGSLRWQGIDTRNCLTTFSSDWLATEAVLNLAMLSVLGLGACLATHRVWVSLVVVVLTGVMLEMLQDVTGLGSCESGDLVRNVIGGIVGILFGWLILKLLGPDLPRSLQRGEIRERTLDLAERSGDADTRSAGPGRYRLPPKR